MREPDVPHGDPSNEACVQKIGEYPTCPVMMVGIKKKFRENPCRMALRVANLMDPVSQVGMLESLVWFLRSACLCIFGISKPCAMQSTAKPYFQSLKSLGTVAGRLT